jgi:hypothetical protein
MGNQGRFEDGVGVKWEKVLLHYRTPYLNSVNLYKPPILL